jgi:hypothetical protein
VDSVESTARQNRLGIVAVAALELAVMQGHRQWLLKRSIENSPASCRLTPLWSRPLVQAGPRLDRNGPEPPM